MWGKFLIRERRGTSIISASKLDAAQTKLHPKLPYLTNKQINWAMRFEPWCLCQRKTPGDHQEAIHILHWALCLPNWTKMLSRAHVNSHRIDPAVLERIPHSTAISYESVLVPLHRLGCHFGPNNMALPIYSVHSILAQPNLLLY